MKKLTVEFSDGMTEVLEKIAEERKTTKVDIIRNALALYHYVYQEAVKKQGRKLSIISEKDGKILKDIVLHS